MKKKPLFSIITATYNSEKTLAKAIESVIMQSYTEVEHIIIDGNSTDNTVAVIKQYAQKYPDKIKWISEPDDGIYSAINKGIDLANGNIIGILGSDDSYLPDIFQKIAQEFSKDSKLKLVYGLVNYYLKGIHIETKGPHHNNIKNATLAHQACFYSKEIHTKYGKYSTSYKLAGDYDFLLNISNKEDVTFINLNIPLANFNYSGISSNNYLSYCEQQKVKYKNKIISKKVYMKNIIKANVTNILKRIFK
ncbi:MAG: glycosyltransferase [Spirochaetaceae bacterium]|nr:glycosyltransferase [Spirochaetaceae bacterium]